VRGDGKGGAEDRKWKRSWSSFGKEKRPINGCQATVARGLPNGYQFSIVLTPSGCYDLIYSERSETLLSEEFSQFIESWGSMGVLWGINRSMARIHALIILSDKPVDLDTVASELSISRGNASMSLKELRNWGVIQRVHIAGDRRDFYIAEPDMWNMLFNIAIERKKREFDPALHALRHLLSEAGIEKKKDVHKRLTDLEETLSTLNRIMDKFLGNEKVSKAMLELLSSAKR